MDTSVVELLSMSIAQPSVETEGHQQLVVTVGTNRKQLVAVKGQSWLGRTGIPPVLRDETSDMLKEPNVILVDELEEPRFGVI